MWNLFVFGEKFTDTQEISKQLAAETGFKLVTDSDVIDWASRKYGMSPKKLSKAIFEKRTPFENLTHAKQRAIAYFRSVLAENLLKNDSIYVGLSGHLFPKDLPQVYRVFITAEADYRVQNAFIGDHLPEKEALKKIHHEDEKAFRWCRRIYNNSDWDADSYHQVLPTHILNKDSAVQMALKGFETFKQTQTATASPQGFDDFKLAAAVEVVLAEKGYPVSVRTKDGDVLITIEEHVLQLNRLSQKLTEAVKELPGIKHVVVGVSSNFNQADQCCHTTYEIPLETQLNRYEKVHEGLRKRAISTLPAKVKQAGRRPAASNLHLRATN